MPLERTNIHATRTLLAGACENGYGSGTLTLQVEDGEFDCETITKAITNNLNSWYLPKSFELWDDKMVIKCSQSEVIVDYADVPEGYRVFLNLFGSSTGYNVNVTYSDTHTCVTDSVFTTSLIISSIDTGTEVDGSHVSTSLTSLSLDDSVEIITTTTEIDTSSTTECDLNETIVTTTGEYGSLYTTTKILTSTTSQCDDGKCNLTTTDENGNTDTDNIILISTVEQGRTDTTAITSTNTEFNSDGTIMTATDEHANTSTTIIVSADQVEINSTSAIEDDELIQPTAIVSTQASVDLSTNEDGSTYIYIDSNVFERSSSAINSISPGSTATDVAAMDYQNYGNKMSTTKLLPMLYIDVFLGIMIM